ncbi:hypothetical protein CPB86DRAFT_356552 [Serendipita vermifera]|nr:hypothetical protein CPB86DRAFT_356552 [Serendipita vermifera]
MQESNTSPRSESESKPSPIRSHNSLAARKALGTSNNFEISSRRLYLNERNAMCKSTSGSPCLSGGRRQRMVAGFRWAFLQPSSFAYVDGVGFEKAIVGSAIKSKHLATIRDNGVRTLYTLFDSVELKIYSNKKATRKDYYIVRGILILPIMSTF